MMSPVSHRKDTDAPCNRSCALARNEAELTDSAIASQPSAIMSTSAVLPEPLAPITATRPGFRAILGVAAHGAPLTSIPAITCDEAALIGDSGPTQARPLGSIQACRKESNSTAPLIHE